jgi:2-C-methyl-D-erythritol 4-phosphate cytidylyltransferase
LYLVVPEDLIRDTKRGFETSECRIIAGGERRQDSVFNALQEVEAATVVVHDAARPLATIAMVRDVVGALSKWDGAIVAVPADETLKVVDGERVTRTVDRSTIWQAQTPQGFRTEVLREAHRRAREEGFHATDDASLVEQAGGSVAVVLGDRTNLKITRPEDFDLAQAILESRS